MSLREPVLRASTTRLGLLAGGLSLVTIAGLALTQPSWSAIVLLPLCIVGVLLGVGAGRATVAGSIAPARKGGPAQPDAEPTPPAIISSPLIDAVDAVDPITRGDVDRLAALRHEFRTPLNAVLGFSDVLLRGIDGEVNDSQREDLEIIRASGMKLQILLDSALDLQRLAGEGLKLEVDGVDAREVVERAAEEARQLWASKRRASVSVPETACQATIDAPRLRRCLLVLADFLGTQYRDANVALDLSVSEENLTATVSASPSGRLDLDALPTPSEVTRAEDPMKIRRWPVAVSTEIVSAHDGSLYHGDDPARFVIRIPRRVVS